MGSNWATHIPTHSQSLLPCFSLLLTFSLSFFLSFCISSFVKGHFFPEKRKNIQGPGQKSIGQLCHLPVFSCTTWGRKKIQHWSCLQHKHTSKLTYFWKRLKMLKVFNHFPRALVSLWVCLRSELNSSTLTARTLMLGHHGATITAFVFKYLLWCSSNLSFDRI